MVITTHELQTSDVRHLHCSDPRVADEVAKRSTDRCTGLTRAFQRCATSCLKGNTNRGEVAAGVTTALAEPTTALQVDRKAYAAGAVAC
jgi:hypothetical protein